MNLKLKVNENTVLHYIESTSEDYDEEKKEDVVIAYQLSFGFYDCHYFVGVTRKDLDNDSRFVLMEGNSKLFDSFESQCEGELWPLIKEKCDDFDVWCKELSELEEEA